MKQAFIRFKIVVKQNHMIIQVISSFPTFMVPIRSFLSKLFTAAKSAFLPRLIGLTILMKTILLTKARLISSL